MRLVIINFELIGSTTRCDSKLDVIDAMQGGSVEGSMTASRLPCWGTAWVVAMTSI